MMQWKQLLCADRKRSYPTEQTPVYKQTDTRSEFRKDYHRIIGSASFRRLQDKTQVFPLDQNDFVRTRLTHSLEVSSFAKSLGDKAFSELIKQGADPQIDDTVRENAASILECAGLLHDIGNPPFGHFGEDSIRYWFAQHLETLTFRGKPLTACLTQQMQQDLLHFEGNAQALRLVSKLHYLIDEYGMHLTFALLNTLIKYPVSSTEIDKDAEDIRFHKMGYYLAEEALFREITQGTGAVGCRYPLTWLLEAADDIAYLTADIEDAVKKGILSYTMLLHELRQKGQSDAAAVLEDRLAKAYKHGAVSPETNAVQNWIIMIQNQLLNAASDSFVNHYSRIMNGTFRHELLKKSSSKDLVCALKKISCEHIYDSKTILGLEISAGNIIDALLDQFVPAAIVYGTELDPTPLQARLMPMISDNYRRIYEVYSKEAKAAGDENYCLYLRLLLVTDYICGMTDSFAKSTYQLFHGIG